VKSRITHANVIDLLLRMLWATIFGT
jgi:hypothetical protein